MKYILAVLVGLCSGFVVGGAYAAFISLLRIVPRLVQLTKTHRAVKLYQNAYALGVIIFSIINFTDISFNFSNILVIIFGLIMGTFTGMFSSALAEVLNVIPVMSKKLKIKDEESYLVYALVFGKVAGSLYFWLIFVNGG